LNYLQNIVLDIFHDPACPEAGVKIEVGFEHEVAIQVHAAAAGVSVVEMVRWPMPNGTPPGKMIMAGSCLWVGLVVAGAARWPGHAVGQLCRIGSGEWRGPV